MDEKVLLELEQLIDYHFSDSRLITEALAHSSQTKDRLLSNERLEFLGDSVLAIVICQTLFTRFPTYLEGDLTKIKSMLVSRKTCAKIANSFGLSRFVKVGKGMDSTKAMSGSVAAGALESIIAAIYLDGGFQAATDFIIRQFGATIDKVDAKQHQENFKSLLQHHCQQEFSVTPIYELLDEKGPDHDKCFETVAVIRKRQFQSAWGVTKKEAEQKAAYNALVELGLLAPDETDA